MSELSADEQTFLDEAYERLRTTRSTFTENEALQAAFDDGYDLDILFDPRFARAELKQGTTPPHYRLVAHTIANTYLINELQAGTWDGYNLEAKLAELDAELDREAEAQQPATEKKETHHHIFYPHDPRLFKNRQGAWEAHGERQITVPLGLKAELDLLLAGLTNNWLQLGTPLTISRIIEILRNLGWKSSERPNAARYVRSWLLATKQFQRVNQDYWIPVELLPTEMQQSRLQVFPLHIPDKPQEHIVPQDVSASDPAYQTTHHFKTEPTTFSVGGTATRSQVSWTTYVRTANLNQGFLTVPKAMRVVYPPQFPGEDANTVFRGRWFADNTMLWIWLDHHHHRLYGPDLLEKFFELDTGDKLRIDWQTDEITFHIVGHSDEIQQEESRLIDIDELKTLRLGIGENYRQALQAILATQPEGLELRELVKALSARQNHTVSTRTVRALLTGGSFRHYQKRWFAALDDKVSARALSATILETIVPPTEHTHITPSEYTRTRVNAIHQRLTEITDILRDNI